MSQVVIENPIINSPFDEPTRHFRFADAGITNEEVDGRRISSYFVPIARPKKTKGAAQLALPGTEWTQDRIEENKLVNDIIASTDGTAALKPILRPYDTIGSTRYVDFDTTWPVYATKAQKCHISHVVADTDSWEQKMAEALEDMPEVIRYVKNHNLSFTIPYTLNGEEKNYIPDFIACIDDDHSPDDLLNLIVEVTGEKKKDKAAKVATARTLWVPAINNHSGFGRWTFIEVADPWDAQNAIRKGISI